jgi:CheY-like chemotaxis protein
VAAASDGEEGLKLFQDGPFDLVFTDLGMPGISGWEVAQEVKRLNAGTPVILVTGWGIQVDDEKKNMHGIDYVISKPFNIDQVTSLVQEELLKTSRDKQATG